METKDKTEKSQDQTKPRSKKSRKRRKKNENKLKGNEEKLVEKLACIEKNQIASAASRRRDEEVTPHSGEDNVETEILLRNKGREDNELKAAKEPAVSEGTSLQEKKESTAKGIHGRKGWATVARGVMGKSEQEDSVDIRSSSSSSANDSPRVSRMSSRLSLLEDIAQGNLDNWDPETCVTLLRIPSVTNYSGIKKLIQQASREWLEDFLSIDGLGVLFECLAHRSGKKTLSISDALLQLECVMCVKAVMNSEIGLGHITRDKSYTRKLAQVLDSENMLVKQQVFELLSALSMYSEDGHSLALDALNNYKVFRSRRYRFQLVIDEIRNGKVVEYQASLLAFVNCIVLGEGNLSARCALRNEFLGLDLQSILDQFRNSDHEAIALQVLVFDENLLDDQDELFGSTENQLTLNHYEIFNIIFNKVRDTPQSFQLLTLLKSLSQLDPAESSSDDVWALLERIGTRSLTGGNITSTFSDSLVHPQSAPSVSVSTQTISVNKVRNTFQEVSPRQSTEKQEDLTLHNASTQTPLEDLPYSLPVNSPLSSVITTKAPPSSGPSISGTSATSSTASSGSSIPDSPSLPNASVPFPPPLPGSIPSPPRPPPSSSIPSPPQTPESIPPPPPLPGSIPPPPPLPGSIPPPPPLPGLIPPPPPLPGSIPPPPPLPGSIPPPPPPPGSIPPPPPPPGSFIPSLPNSLIPPPPLPPNSSIPFPPGGPPPPPPPFPLSNKTVSNAIAHASMPVFTQIFSSHLPKPQAKMKCFSWNKVPAQGVGEHSLWKEIHSDLTHLIPSNLDFKEIETLFCQRIVKETTEPYSSKDTGKSKKGSQVMLLDPKTSLNVHIFLKQYKCPPETVASYVANCQNEHLEGDKLRGLLKILPEDSELEIVKEYKDDPEKLAAPEKFFFHLVKIPSYKSLVEGMILMSEFGPEVQVLTPQLDTLQTNCESLLHNDGIKHFFAYVLTLGNFINMGSYAGNAPGFKLSTISKLWETRANQPGVTLLHYIAQTTGTDNPHFLDFADSLEGNLMATDRISVDGIKSEIQTLSNEVIKLKQKLQTSKENLQTIFAGFIGGAERSLTLLEDKISSIEEYRVKLANYYCEEESKFKLEECLANFKTLCIKIHDAKKENKERQEREEKRRKREEERKRLQEEREALNSSGIPLRKKGLIPSKETEECVVDVLLKEIRKGNFKMRKTRQIAFDSRSY